MTETDAPRTPAADLTEWARGRIRECLDCLVLDVEIETVHTGGSRALAKRRAAAVRGQVGAPVTATPPTSAERAALAGLAGKIEASLDFQRRAFSRGPKWASVKLTVAEADALLLLARRAGPIPAVAPPADAEQLRDASVWLPGEGAWLPLADYAALVRGAATAGGEGTDGP